MEETFSNNPKVKNVHMCGLEPCIRCKGEGIKARRTTKNNHKRFWYIECAWCNFATGLWNDYTDAHRDWNKKNRIPGNTYVNEILSSL